MVTFDYTNPLNLIVSFLLVTIGSFGLICNLLMVYVFLKERSEKTAFNCICFFRAISNSIILIIVFLVAFFPKTVLGYSPWPPYIESWMIHIANTLYLGNEYQIVLVAVNRFFALFFPIFYQKILGFPQTTVVLVVIYIYRIVKRIVEMIPETEKECYALYSTDTLAWNYDDDPRCDFPRDALQIITFTFITITILNLITFAKILMFYRNQKEHRDNKETRRRMRKNTILFVQTIFQDSLYLIDLTFTFKLSSWSNHRVWTYISGTLIWECLHAIDGLIMVMFNEKLTVLRLHFTNSLVLPGSVTVRSQDRVFVISNSQRTQTN